MKIEILDNAWNLNLELWRLLVEELSAESRALKQRRSRPGGDSAAQARLDGPVRHQLTALYILRAVARGREHLPKQGLWLRANRYHLGQLPAELVSAAPAELTPAEPDDVGGQRIAS